MATKIEWTNETWNPLAGCTPVSPGCRNCYAANHARRLAGNPNPKVSGPYEGTARTAGDGRAVFTGKVNLLPERLEQPFRWRKPRRVFVNGMSDLFHEDVPFYFVDEVWAVMAANSRHTFQVLTKRPERASSYLRSRGQLFQDEPTWKHPIQTHIEFWINERPTPEDAGLWSWPLPNVWVGTSVEDQERADERIPHLLRCPAAVRFLSCEPLLGPVDLGRWIAALGNAGQCFDIDGRRWHDPGDCRYCRAPLHWVIVGGESGPQARPCDVAWIRSLVEQCQEAGVAAFVKQLGADPRVVRPTPSKRWPDSETEYRMDFSSRKGGNPEEWPPDLRVREFPREEVAHGD